MNNNELKQLKTWIREELQELKDEIKEVRDKLDNHLASVSKDITEIKTNVSWLTRFFWLIMTPAFCLLVAAFYSLVIK